MDNPTSLLFFALFGIILFVMYIAVRRRWASPLVIAAIGVVASIVVITLMSLSEGNHIYQALFVGLLVGGLFSAGTLAIASYFLSQEERHLSPPPSSEE